MLMGLNDSNISVGLFQSLYIGMIDTTKDSSPIKPKIYTSKKLRIYGGLWASNFQSSLFMTTMPAELLGVTVKDGVFGRVVSMDESRKP